MPTNPNLNGNGEDVHEDDRHHLTTDELARRAYDRMLEVYQMVGTLTAEVSQMRSDMSNGFDRLGVRVRRTRAELSTLSDEVEDTKTHHLRSELRSYKSKAKWIVGTLSAVLVIVAGGIILHFLHIGP